MRDKIVLFSAWGSLNRARSMDLLIKLSRRPILSGFSLCSVQDRLSLLSGCHFDLKRDNYVIPNASSPHVSSTVCTLSFSEHNLQYPLHRYSFSYTITQSTNGVQGKVIFSCAHLGALSEAVCCHLRQNRILGNPCLTKSSRATCERLDLRQRRK